MKKVAIIITSLAVAATAAVAFAGDRGDRGGGMERVKAADKNGDGLISRAEAAALPKLATQFDAIDTNKDGQISSDELRANHEAKRAERWKKLDANADGKVSKAEAQANAPRMFDHFDQLDANKDGFITQEEMKAGHGKRGSK